MGNRPLNYIIMSTDWLGCDDVKKFAAAAGLRLERAHLIHYACINHAALRKVEGIFSREDVTEAVAAACARLGMPVRLGKTVEALLSPENGLFDDAGQGLWRLHNWPKWSGRILEWRADWRNEKAKGKDSGQSSTQNSGQKATGFPPGVPPGKPVEFHPELRPDAAPETGGEIRVQEKFPPKAPPTGGASQPPGSSPQLSQAATPAAAQDPTGSGWKDFVAAWPPEYLVGAEAAEAAFRQRLEEGETPSRMIAAAKHYHPWCAAQRRTPKDPARFLTPGRGMERAPYLEFVDPRPIPAHLNGAGSSSRRTRFDPDKDY